MHRLVRTDDSTNFVVTKTGVFSQAVVVSLVAPMIGNLDHNEMALAHGYVLFNCANMESFDSKLKINL